MRIMCGCAVEVCGSGVPRKSLDIDIHLLPGSDRVADQNRGLLSLAVPEEEQYDAHHQSDDVSDDVGSGHFH